MQVQQAITIFMALCEWLCRRDRDPAPGGHIQVLTGDVVSLRRPLTTTCRSSRDRNSANHNAPSRHPWLSQQGSAKPAPFFKAWKYGFSRAVFRMGSASCTSWLIPGMRMRGRPSAGCLSCEQSVGLNAHRLSNTVWNKAIIIHSRPTACASSATKPSLHPLLIDRSLLRFTHQFIFVPTLLGPRRSPTTQRSWHC